MCNHFQVGITKILQSTVILLPYIQGCILKEFTLFCRLYDNLLFRAPHDCLQYLTGPSGLVQSYNWLGAVQIQGSDYTSCIRREDGYCAISFYPAQDGSTVSSYSSIDTFQVDATAIAVNTNSITGTWSATIDGYVMISNDATGSSSHSGDIFAAEDTSTINTRVYSNVFLL